MKSDFTVIIPARFASSRLPGKMLANINDKPMIQHVYERACLSEAKQILIATDHSKIFDVAQKFGAEVLMTSSNHPSGTDRLQEVCAKKGLGEDEIVVNIQGDEPLIPPTVINQVATLLAEDTESSVATLCENVATFDDFIDPNVVKVVVDNQQRALYFSRATIPWPRDEFVRGPRKISLDGLKPLRHLGIYAYRVALLNRFITWPMASLEGFEKLEQLRVLANGEKIAVAKACEFVPAGIDTEEDLARIRKQLSREN